MQKGKDLYPEIHEIRRTDRKTIAIQITEEGKVIVKAPLNASDEAIMRVVLKNKKWIESKIKEVFSRPRAGKKEFVNGESFLYLGRPYKLYIVENQEEPLRFENGFFLSKKFLHCAREVFIAWYKEAALEIISQRVEFYAKMAGLKYGKIRITDAQRRWGSCSPNNNLNFSWRLIMAPLPAIDYVVVHELAHIEEKNHSKRFWRRVKALMPDYEKYHQWFKENGHLLKL
jgi:predicted metal-dependent hydrolase